MALAGCGGSSDGGSPTAVNTPPASTPSGGGGDGNGNGDSNGGDGGGDLVQSDTGGGTDVDLARNGSTNLAMRINSAHGALAVGSSGPTDSPYHFGVWLDQDDNLITWSNPPEIDEGYSLGTASVSDTSFSGTANYDGEVFGLGYYGTKGGRFNADIELTANFEDDSHEVTGTVSNFQGPGANPAWTTVTLGNGGAVTGGGTTDGEWGHSFYRKEASGNPDGVTGHVDLTFSDGGAAGAFHATETE